MLKLKAREEATSLIMLGYLLVGLLFVLAICTGPMYDDGTIATVAKNVANGIGYCTSNYVLYCFDPGITTGPALVLPAALAIFLFGTQPFVPGLVNLLAVLGLAFALARILLARFEGFAFVPRAIGHARALQLLFVLLILLLFFVGNETTNSGEYIAARGFTKLVGEFAAVLLFWAGATLLQGFSPRYWLAGLLMGLGILTKTFVVLPCVFFLAAFLLFSPDRVALARRGGAAVLGGLLVPTLAFEGAELVALGLAKFLVQKQGEVEFFLTFGSGIASAGQIDHFSLALDHLGALGRHFGGPLISIALVGAGFILLCRQRVSPEARWLWAMTAAGAGSLVWWVLLSPMGWMRHAFAGVLSLALVFTLSFLLSWPSLSVRWRRVFSTLLLAYVASQYGLLVNLYDDLYLPNRIDGYRLTLGFLQKQGSATLYGCGHWFSPELEYGLPGALHFRNCRREFTPPTPGHPALLVRSEFYNWEHNAENELFRRHCEESIVFRADPYVVSSCR